MLLEKLQSRKFWIVVAVGIVVVFGNALGLNLDEAQLWQLVSTAAAYLGVQGIRDLLE